VNRSLALAEWHRSRDSLGAAEVLARARYPADALSRAYYAILHAAKAALHVHDVAADSHSAVRRLFGLHLVRSGEIEPGWAAYLSEGLDDRLAADYNALTNVSDKEARENCKRARRFLDRVRSYLLKNGFKQSELRQKRNPKT